MSWSPPDEVVEKARALLRKAGSVSTMSLLARDLWDVLDADSQRAFGEIGIQTLLDKLVQDDPSLIGTSSR